RDRAVPCDRRCVDAAGGRGRGASRRCAAGGDPMTSDLRGDLPERPGRPHRLETVRDAPGPAPEELHRVVVRAPGKINLSLAVGARHDRGYHRVATVFQAVDLYETVTAPRAEQMSLVIDSQVAGEVPVDDSNLALRAGELLRAEYDVPAG